MSYTHFEMLATTSTAWSTNSTSAWFGILSVCCWLIVSPPQILENFRNQSADGLSIWFVGIWLTGDIFNVLGATLQHVVPVSMVQALYFAIVDCILLAQIVYYKKQCKSRDRLQDVFTEEQEDLLPNSDDQHHHDGSPCRTRISIAGMILILIVIFIAITLGWLIFSNSPRICYSTTGEEFNIIGQVFGYLCASLYVGARTQQLRLNHQRKSTEGVSVLFFCFATVANIAYLTSICTCPPCDEDHNSGGHGNVTLTGVEPYVTFITVNASWILGSAGSLLLDSAMLFQFRMYRARIQ